MTEEWAKKRFETWARSIMYPDTHMTIWEMLETVKKDLIDEIINDLKEKKEDL